MSRLNRLMRAYPLLIPIYAGLTLYLGNLADVAAIDVIRPLLAAVGLAVLVVVACRMAVRDERFARLAAGGLLLAFFSYGHLYGILQDTAAPSLDLGHHRYALVITGVALLVWLLASWLWGRRSAEVEQWLSALLAISVVLVSAQISFRWITARIALDRSDGNLLGEPLALEAGAQPDILYLVLDGYGRSDVLNSVYEFDNTGFLRELETRGFVVAERSVANYNQTVLSLASALNMAYLPQVLDCEQCASLGREQVTEHLKHSLVRSELENLGYEIVAFETGYGPIEWRDADDFIAVSGGQISNAVFGYLFGSVSPFESQFMATTGLRLAMDSAALRRWTLNALGDMSPFLQHARRVEAVLESIPRAVARPGPTFVYAHVISPHPPFVFNADGSLAENAGAFNLADGDSFGGTPDEYVARYREQVQFINARVLASLDQLLASQERETMIMIQGDHGPGSQLVWESASDSNLSERFGILNAYRLPAAWLDDVYPTITPVNSFRLLFRRAFGADLEPLPDESYFSSWSTPLDFENVTPALR